MTHLGSEYANSLLDSDVILGNLASEMLNVALKRGSSQHGKARLASTGEKCVLATYLF